MKQPKFKYQVFNSIKKFDQFLREKTHTIIHLKDLGQDLSVIRVHSSGEILHTDFQATTYNGQFIELSEVKEGQPLTINGKEYGRLIVHRIKVIENEPA